MMKPRGIQCIEHYGDVNQLLEDSGEHSIEQNKDIQTVLLVYFDEVNKWSPGYVSNNL